MTPWKDDTRTILVVDDEKVIRDGCSRIFNAEGYRVLTAADGQEALDVLAVEDVHVILCDLQMPVKGVFQVLDEVNERYPNIPLIVITGYATVNNAVECMRKGACDFITKPFRADHVTHVVRKALEKQFLEHQARELQEERARNLHDLAMEQSRLRTIINCMADGVLVTNKDLEVVLHNPASLRLLDLAPSGANPAPLTAYVADEFAVEGLRLLLEKAGTEAGLISQDFSSGKIQLRAVSAPVYGPAGEVLGSVTVFHDVTSLRQLDELKSGFVNMVSHELRSPLSTIMQQLTVILEGLAGDVTEKQRELLGRSSEKLRNLLDLINDLLDIARIEGGRGIQQQVPLNIGDVLTQTMEFIRPRAENQRLQLTLDLPPKLPSVLADARSMEELFTNLISNAINYSPDGGRVRVSVAVRAGSLEVSVSDDGVGIANEEIPKIFDKFYRVKHPRTRQVIGTGLGLAIVKGIVESHRGAVEVESKPGVGSTFRVLLPVIG